MSLESLDQFRQLVLENQGLQAQLQEAPDMQNLIIRAVQLGKENGYDFTAEEVRQQVETARGQQDISFPLENLLDDPIVQGY